MPTLTIFTPTFNRAYTLHLCYESLQRQTCKDFVWLIIDDGSTDNTKELVESWVCENKVPITYHYQANQGMHGAHNKAYELTDTELCTCVDSDDYLADNAVEMIINYWHQYGNEKYAGIVGLDAYRDGKLVGLKFPDGLYESSFVQVHRKFHGDKKFIYRTKVFKSYPPYPVFEGEKLCPLSYKSYLIDEKYPLLLLNEVLCYIEYLPDGSTRNIFRQYKAYPRSFAEFRKLTMVVEKTFKERFKAAIHYVASSIFSKNRNFIYESPRKFMTICALPFGGILCIYINLKIKRQYK